MTDITLFVRQELPPAVRPPPAQPARGTPATSAEDNSGWATFSGGGGGLIDLSFSYSASFSRSQKQEKERLVDQVRVKQVTQDPQTGEKEVSEENYVDVESPKEMNMVNSNGEEEIWKFAMRDDAGRYQGENVEVLQEDVRIA